ncbi:AEC family transporter [Streptococcus parauberis]|uniref:Membrane transport protein n=1 Tax=Streptococcus parauberis TaxID=1348 RepID=A0A854WRQ5_9STRE|nr:hypothetical protein [Streptococcus parauberis]EMF50334.1 Transporter [Streptococcus parauberis KRS-02109]PCH12804.1 Membrane transport protein [Streptococcus parauberis]RFE02636.1 Membrane transport protein [Streptococcus parauberis]UWM86490.1 permease [Streptococcus parauberis]UWM88461.1 permease [Streptococcus parauberis]
MLTILIKASSFVLVVCLGYFFKKRGLISLQEGHALSKIVMTVTLPCALLLSAKSITLSRFLLIPLGLALLANGLMLALGYIRGRKAEPLSKTQNVIQLSGFNIGNFAFPFVQSFFPVSYLMYVILFDTGNAIMVFGGNYAVASLFSPGSEKLTVGAFLKKLLHSVPFVTYLICFVLSILQWHLPGPILTIAKVGADANPFLAMFVLGVMVDLKFNRQALQELGQLLGLRLFGSGLMVALVTLLPLDMVVKQMLTICLLAPIAVVTPLYAQELGIKSSVPATVNSLTILSSIVLITIFLLSFA